MAYLGLLMALLVTSSHQACAILNDHQGVLHLGDTNDLSPLFRPQADVGQFAFLRPGQYRDPVGNPLGKWFADGGVNDYPLVI